TTIPAVAGTDYTAVSGTLTFAGTAGETMQISVPVLGDLTSEEAETFFVNLSNVAASGLNVTIADAQGLGTITNDDSTEVTLQLSAGTGSEAAGTVITITATTAQPVSGNQTVDVQVTGTGITAGDYVLSSTTIQIADGQTSGTVTLTVAADTSIEGTETATLSLVSPSSGLTLGSPIAADLVISDNSTVTLDAVSRFPGSSPTLTWQSVPGAARYEVWFSRITPSPARVYLDSNVTTTSWTPPDVLPTAFYKYWVRAVDAAGNAGAWSTPNTFEVKPTLIGPLTPVFSARPTFAWNPVPFATSYQLFLRTTSGDIIHNNIVGTSFTPTTDLPTGVIRWWIRATDHTGNRGWSDAGVTNTDKRAIVTGPTSPTTVTPPTITWTGVVGAGRYVLHVINVATNEVVIRQDNLTGTSYTPPTALPAAGYRIWVKAIDAETNLFSSGVWSRAYNLTITASESQAENSAALVSLGPDVQDQLSGDAATERTQPVDIATAAEKSSSTDETTLARNEAKSSLIRNSGVQSVPISAGDRPSPVVQELQLLDALMAQPLDLVALFDQQKANV
ncbi:MAG: hypothetical protein KDA81_10905, partial [Planctomycetaceae bacterium]|nr:hypothetical protein [Planctomycetaceae bacterium]